MKILIAALPKTGTTALFFKIAHSLKPAPILLFEPTSFQPAELGIAEHDLATKPVLHKLLLTGGEDWQSFAGFEKKIFLIRDPRDTLISTFLYSTRHTRFYRDPIALNRLLDALRDKQRNPLSLSFCELIAVRDSLNADSFLAMHQRWRDFSVRCEQETKEKFLFLYRDLIGQHFSALESYLGFPINPAEHNNHLLDRVRRTSSRGNWRAWFTPADVEFLRPQLSPYMQRYGFEDDWQLDLNPLIPYEYGPGYVEQNIREKLKLDAGKYQR